MVWLDGSLADEVRLEAAKRNVGESDVAGRIPLQKRVNRPQRRKL